jgi:hypothetical protein
MRYVMSAAGLIALAAGTFFVNISPASAAGPSLQRAVANTDAARYYHEADTIRTSEGGVTVSQTSTEQYDQKHNRESDMASFVVSRPGTKTERYSVAVIMMNNHTYYRSTLNKAGWKVKSGYGYADPNSGQSWVRAPLSFASLAHAKISAQGAAPGGTYHLQFQAPKSATVKTSGHADVWISTRGTPYIVHYAENLTATEKGKTATQVLDTRLTKFNRPVTISAPKLGT